MLNNKILRVLSLLCVVACLMSLFGCNQPNTNTDVSAFSYAEHAKTFKDDSPGVKHSGFVNTNEFEISSAEDALAHAKKECTIAWDTSHVSFDNELSVWMVSFYTEGTLGGDQCVYLDSNGKTLLIVYGE